MTWQKKLQSSNGQIPSLQKKKSSKVDTKKQFILPVTIRNCVLCRKSFLVLKFHSMNHKSDDISWNISHMYNFSLTLAIRQNTTYAFSEISILSTKIHLQFYRRQTRICRHTQYIKS